MIDPFHLEAYGVTSVNYNRDIEIFPALEAMFHRIYGSCPYKSPTDMGVNMAGNAIVNDEVCREASGQEILRRYYAALYNVKRGLSDPSEVQKLEMLMNTLHLAPEQRRCVPAALAVAERTGEPATAIELPDGTVITGKTTTLMGASCAALLNALKHLAGIDDALKLIAPEVLTPIMELKLQHLGNHNPRLHTDEILIALAMSAVTDPTAKKAMDQLSRLRGSEVHSTVVLASVDEGVFRKLGVNVTWEPVQQAKKLYHK